jgi:hypothetical protein
MFGDDDINFDMQLERFDVDTGALKEPAVERIFRAWVEDWEEKPERRMIVLRRHVCLQSIKDLFSMIWTQVRECIFCLGSKH